MMQNLTLPTSQTLALGNTLNSLDATKSSANINQSSVEPNTSFEMMLKKQVKAHKDSMQDKTTHQKATQKNLNQNTVDNQKKSQVKSDKNDTIEVQNTQNDDDEALDSSISMSQMLGDAKSILGDKRTVESSGDGNLLNVGNQEILEQPGIANIPPGLVTSINNTFQIQNKNVDLKDTGLNKALLESTNNQVNSSILPSVNDNKSNLLEPKQGNDLVTKELPQDRLIWASVSSSNLSQSANQSSDTLNKSMLENTQLLESANNLMVSTNLQNQPVQSNSILQMHQLSSSNQINAYPGKAGWDQAISQKIVWMVGAAEQTATLSLNPPDLGPLQVVINVRNDMADTTFISNNAEVRQALQDGMDNLRAKMAESGIQLGQANVNSGGRPQQEFSQAPLSSQSSRFSENDDANSSLLPTKQTTRQLQTNNGLVDTFA